MDQDLPDSNSMERGYLLPPGCKNLIDALKGGGEAQRLGWYHFKTFRLNEKITAEYVRVILTRWDIDRVMELKDALALAKTMEMDLVEIAPEANPPVCALCDSATLMRALSKWKKKD